jgi:hypothetical protein
MGPRVAFHVREEGAGNVRFAVLLLAERRLHEVVAAIEDAPLQEVISELLRGNQRGMHDADYGRNPDRNRRDGKLIRPHVRRTPVVAEGNLVFKLELLQHSGSFKARGAFANL